MSFIFIVNPFIDTAQKLAVPIFTLPPATVILSAIATEPRVKRANPRVPLFEAPLHIANEPVVCPFPNWIFPVVILLNIVGAVPTAVPSIKSVLIPCDAVV